MIGRTASARRGYEAMRLIAGVALALSILAPPAGAQTEPADPFAGAATGTLWLQIELSGSGRTDLPNGVEWSSLKASRKMSVELRMLDMGNRNVPIVSSGNVSGSSVPAGMAVIEEAMAACNGDHACQAATMMRHSKDFISIMEAHQPKLDSDRFRNWAADRRKACATGTLSVRDLGEGMVISPPNPAAPYRFERAGSVEPQKQAGRLMEALCVADLTYDTERGMASLRLPAHGLDVPVALTGHAFTHEKFVPLIEGVATIELFDQPVASDEELSGRAEFPRLGSASHNSGQVAAPLRATLGWRFKQD